LRFSGPVFGPSLFAQKGNYPPIIEGTEEMVYKNASDTDLKLWMFKPEGWQPGDNRPAIVFSLAGMEWRVANPVRSAITVSCEAGHDCFRC